MGDEIMAKQVEELEKEKKELQVRLKAQEKKVDHLERAKRLEEIPLLKLQFEEFKEEAKVVWEEQEKDRIEGEKKQRASDVENRDRMVRMRDDKDKYLESLLKERKNVFEKKIAEFNVLVAEERKIRLERRKEERRRKWMREREEEEQRRRDELAIKEKEEREAREALEKQREKEEYEKKKAELEEIERKKREKEREIEEKMERDREERSENSRDDRGGDRGGPWRAGGGRKEDEGPRSGAWRGGGGGGGWRDREKRKEDEWGPR